MRVVMLMEYGEQYQEAKDQQISFAQGNRSKVPKKPQTCTPRHNEGTRAYNIDGNGDLARQY